jgi:PST family polysaccharide transporter
LVESANQPQQFRHVSISAVRWLSYTVVTALAFVAGASVPLTELILGPEWARSGELLIWLTVAGMAQTWGSVGAWIYVASGRTAAQLRWALFSRPVHITAMFAGIPWGVQGIAFMYAASTSVLLLPSLGNACRNSPVSFKSMLGALLSTAPVPLTVLIVARYVTSNLPGLNALSLLAWAALAAALTWLVLSSASRHGRAVLKTAFNQIA